MAERILDVKNLKIHFPLKHKRGQFVRAVDGVSLTLDKGEILSLVGESGSGKTTIGKAILRIIDPTSGSVNFMGREIGADSVDNAIGKDIFHRLARLIGFVFAAFALALFLLLPVAAAKETGASLSGADMLFSAALRDSVGVTGGMTVFSIVLALLAAASAVLCALLKKKLRFAAGAAGIGLLPAILISLSMNGALSMGSGLSLSMLCLALSALVLVLLPRFYTPPLGKELHRHAQMIFQDPYQRLNPRHYIIDLVAEPLDVNGLVTTPEERERKVQTALERAGLQPARDYFYRYPYELSGGQRQRVAIASSLILEPDFIVADEPVSMIDASIRLGIIKLMKKMQVENNIAFLFITHDLSLAWLIFDRIAIMYLGRIMEVGSADQIIKDCRHPYSKALMDVMPIPGMTRESERVLLKGDIPSAASDIRGCKFASRCPNASEICKTTPPELVEVDEGHMVARHNLDAKKAEARNDE